MKVTQRVPKWLIVFASLMTVVGVSTWQGWKWWTWAIASPAVAETQAAAKPVKLNIPEGTSAQEIGQDLEALGLIRSATAWKLWARWLMLKEAQGGFQAGTYELSATESMLTIARKIWSGEVMQRSFTIPEGWSIQQMAAYFEQQGFFSSKEFLAATDRVSLAKYPWLPTTIPSNVSRLEGYLYPDTYKTTTSVTSDLVVQQMLERFEQVALPIYQQAKQNRNLSLAEWVTLSSIVEKEAVVPSERSLIAGVFLNRLQKGMPLGADPTVEYGLGIQQTPDRPLTLAEVNTPSPYNTYLNPGLPPTPIASPGVASLKAVLAPATTDYLYFVARYDGTHVFSRTLREHQMAQNQIHDQRDAAKRTDSSTVQKPVKAGDRR